jgi:hypothetical protein
MTSTTRNYLICDRFFDVSRERRGIIIMGTKPENRYVLSVSSRFGLEHCNDLLHSSQSGPQLCNICVDSSRSPTKKIVISWMKKIDKFKKSNKITKKVRAHNQILDLMKF